MRNQHLQLRQLHQPLIRRICLALLAVIWLAGCARTPFVAVDEGHLPRQAELSEVPFFPQEEYQCGPAALATMLNHRGLASTPEGLVDRVYLPERQGSLQVEMVAAARAHGLLVYSLAPRMETLLAEVAAGNPVLVLQNLAFNRWPQWHFAVVVGYDLDEQIVILRSGTEARRKEGFREFQRAWFKGQRWAVLTVQPGQIPHSAELAPWLEAASDLEETGQQMAAEQAYAAAVEHWDSGLALFALANSQYQRGDGSSAEQSLRDSLRVTPDFAPGWFNLSHLLAEGNCLDEAASARACAARLSPQDSRFRTELALPLTDEGAACRPLPACPVD
ncbi:PA2778 family cysteine peptidase [Stutzerimonas tarimensis]|uniref:PA2778 family cysteine peptidase n=1 Tax=Stutzerimonas tarimensis TaxID=1507735 RepID=A0ABV7TB20_9GAMM